MSIQIANNALDNCTSIEQVVALINNEIATDASAEMVAAKYAFDGASDAGCGTGDAELEVQLDALREAGAEFDYSDAFKLAKSQNVDLVAQIVEKIKKINDARPEGSTISKDQSNEEIQAILSLYGLSDDEDDLESALGRSGLDTVRDAEQGIY